MTKRKKGNGDLLFDLIIVSLSLGFIYQFLRIQYAPNLYGPLTVPLTYGSMIVTGALIYIRFKQKRWI